MLVTDTKLVEFNPAGGKMTMLAENGFWSYLYPNSIVICEGAIYVGMRGGIMRADEERPAKQVWLTKE